jgi:hypothetical protein
MKSIQLKLIMHGTFSGVIFSLSQPYCESASGFNVHYEDGRKIRKGTQARDNPKLFSAIQEFIDKR